MAVETLGSIDQILNSSNAADWAKSAKVDWDKTSPIATPEVGNKLPLDQAGFKSFGELLADAVANVNGLQEEANKAIQKLASGKSKNIEETMMAVEKAELAFKMMNQIRLKVVEAYREVMRMQI
jgi:flagellar hook-basal body complex protein FliE